MRFAIFGLAHDHAGGFLPLTRNRPDAQLVGIIEPDHEVAARFAKRFNLGPDLFFDSLEALLAKTNVDAVSAFTSTYDHPKVVELCAPHHLTVMMEKPLAVNMKAARAIRGGCEGGWDRDHCDHVRDDDGTPQMTRCTSWWKRSMPLAICERLWCMTGIAGRRKLAARKLF